MPIHAITDALAMQMVNTIVGAISAMFTAYIGYKIQQLNRGQATIARDQKVAALEVKDTLVVATGANAARLDTMARIGQETHALVNGGMTSKLRSCAVALRRVAELTGHVVDLDAAADADKELAEHLARQAIIEAAQARARAEAEAGPRPVVVVNPAPIAVEVARPPPGVSP